MVLLPTPLPVVISVDLAPSMVILFVLRGLSIRAAHDFGEGSELPSFLPFGRHRG
jgi:hypothetical protein